jgi:hypothetical protein
MRSSLCVLSRTPRKTTTRPRIVIVPFLYGSVVNGRHWLTERQFVDAVAVTEVRAGLTVTF